VRPATVLLPRLDAAKKAALPRWPLITPQGWRPWAASQSRVRTRIGPPAPVGLGALDQASQRLYHARHRGDQPWSLSDATTWFALMLLYTFGRKTGLGISSQLPGAHKGCLAGDVHGVIADPFDRPRHHRGEETSLTDALVVRLNREREAPPIVLVDRLVSLEQARYSLTVPIGERARGLSERLVGEPNHLAQAVELSPWEVGTGWDLPTQGRDVHALTADPRQPIVHMQKRDRES
jgi:hypothetical protein